jgi:hypothetical protein
MKKINEGSKTYKLFHALSSGEKLTAAQARKRFNIQNIRAEATRIRQAGYAVKAYTPHNDDVRVTTYGIGRPSREVVAAGYIALARGLV